MRFLSNPGRSVAALLAMAALTACDNELPTVTGDPSFPNDQVPVTIELLLDRDAFLLEDTVYEGYESPLDANYRFVANSFDGALTSNALVRLIGFPDSVIYTTAGTTRREQVVNFGESRVIALIDSLSTFPGTRIELGLYPITQDWDPAAVSWENAVDRPGSEVAWQVPGGTTGDAIAVATWIKGAATRDTVRWSIDSLSVQRLARGEYKGLQVRARDVGSRAELSRLSLDAVIRPTGKPDTAIVNQVVAGPQVWVFTPDPPAPPGVLRLGGVTGARPVLNIDLTQMVPTCTPPQTGAGCRQVSLREVTIDRAGLLFDPIPVTFGFRPLASASLVTLRVLEPELGFRAPLGEQLSVVEVLTHNLFASSAAGGLVEIDLSTPISSLVAQGGTELNLALLTNLGPTNFGYAWFDSTPRLRLVYTVKTQPRLP